MAYVTVKDFNNTLKNISNKTLYTKDTADLDTKVKDINTYLYNIREMNLDFDVVSLQRIVMDLSSIKSS